jgi:benzoylformate decarboxylase
VSRAGSDVLIEALESEGVEHVFGNPGTTELPLVDALADRSSPRYVLALQEATAVAMADGYARVTGRPSFVNLHTVAGLANGLGNLQNAAGAGTPMVITAGQQDRKHLIAEPLLSGDLVGLAQSIVKWSHEVRTLGELGTAIRRAFRIAAAPPSGPVFLGIPMDILEEVGDSLLPARSTVDDAPTAGSLAELADLLVTAERPGLVVGNELARSEGGLEAAVALAEALGAPVHGATLTSYLPFPPTNPLWRGPLATEADAIADALGGNDRVLVLGADAFLVYPYTPGPPIPDGTDLLQIHSDPTKLGRTLPARLALLGDPTRSARELTRLLADRVPPERRERAIADGEAFHEQAAMRLMEQALKGRESTPISPAAAVASVFSQLPPDTTFVDEAVTTSLFTRIFHRGTEATSYLWSGAGALGWGLPTAVGVKLGRPDQPVVTMVGDGSAMYAPQALWTAARYGVPIVAVIVDNSEYRILKVGLDRMGGVAARTGNYVGMDLGDPGIDFVALAQSMGVSARRVEAADDVEAAVKEALASGAPQLLHVPISGHRG